MKPLFEKVLIEDDSSIKIKTYTRTRLEVPFHYHPEHEIVFIANTKGKLIVSDAVTTFSQKELIFIGSCVPHLFLGDQNKNGKDKIKVFVIQFKENLFEHVKHLPEFYQAYRFVSKIHHGIKVKRTSRLDRLIAGLNHTHGVEKFNKLSYLLDYIVRKGEYEFIMRPSEKIINTISSQRINEFYSFLSENYQKEINVDEAAKAVHLSKTSFCRFLKKETKKTFSEHLNEVRINFACKLLRETPDTILQVSYAAGFNNPSYFYRQFKKMKLISPVEYRQKHEMQVA